AGETRYPGVYERIEESEYRRALEIARRVVDWAKKVADL
ncbi:MAG: HEPN domain-containing protein, partial [Candidatus Hydrogenedentes bacterium]|nr:HEPN domain-containing protein [Candidatus Hydrogenedentota bacterium]